MDIQIQIARDADASAISETIIKTLRESNARDYPPEIIDRVIESFFPRRSFACWLSVRCWSLRSTVKSSQRQVSIETLFEASLSTRTFKEWVSEDS